MPQSLWQAAAAVAHDHGLWFVSRALRVSYASLKRHAGAAPATSSSGGGGGDVDVDVAHFVELPRTAAADESAAASTTVLELSRGDATLTLRLEGSDAVDVPALVDAFWEHHR